MTKAIQEVERLIVKEKVSALGGRLNSVRFENWLLIESRPTVKTLMSVSGMARLRILRSEN